MAEQQAAPAGHTGGHLLGKLRASFEKHKNLWAIGIAGAGLVLTYLIYKQGQNATSSAAPAADTAAPVGVAPPGTGALPPVAPPGGGGGGGGGGTVPPGNTGGGGGGGGGGSFFNSGSGSSGNGAAGGIPPRLPLTLGDVSMPFGNTLTTAVFGGSNTTQTTKALNSNLTTKSVKAPKVATQTTRRVSSASTLKAVKFGSVAAPTHNLRSIAAMHPARNDEVSIAPLAHTLR